MRIGIATDHGGPREIIEQGRSGFLVAPGDPEGVLQMLVANLDYQLMAINHAAVDEFERIYGVRPSVGPDISSSRLVQTSVKPSAFDQSIRRSATCSRASMS